VPVLVLRLLVLLSLAPVLVLLRLVNKPCANSIRVRIFLFVSVSFD